MEFVSIFVQDPEAEPCGLWSACYPEDCELEGQLDVFQKIFRLWGDTSYLLEFFNNNITDLRTPFWNGMTVDDAIDQVIDEALDFQAQLRCVELQLPPCKNQNFQKIFKQLDKHEFQLRPGTSQFRKARPRVNNAMLRIYAIELEDCHVVTGGAIKLTEKMDRDHLQFEIRRLQRVSDFLKSLGISSSKGLI
ncbi:MAG TPA: hypothetical protein VKR32_03935 [Puia sp.]|nr:hypothetical protein [Puia sp.]